MSWCLVEIIECRQQLLYRRSMQTFSFPTCTRPCSSNSPKPTRMSNARSCGSLLHKLPLWLLSFADYECMSTLLRFGLPTFETVAISKKTPRHDLDLGLHIALAQKVSTLRVVPFPDDRVLVRRWCVRNVHYFHHANRRGGRGTEEPAERF